MATGDKDMDDFLKEVDDIEHGLEDSDQGLSQSTDDLSKTPEEGEQEAEWLKDAGYSELVSKIEEGKELTDDIVKKETQTLTRQQAAAVRRRVDTLNATLRKKQKPPQGHRDVRNVFAPQDQNVPSSNGDNRPAAEVPLRRGGHHKASIHNNRGEYSLTSDNAAGEGGNIEVLSVHAIDKSRSRPTGLYDNVDLDDTTNSPSAKIKKSSDAQSPEFRLQPEPLGTTRVSDLSQSDYRRIRSIAFIEFTSIYDLHNIAYIRRKTKKRFRDSGIFKVPLQSLLDHDLKKHPHLKVPLIVKQLIEFLEKTGLEEEGILRVPGSASRIKQLREEIDDKFNSGHFSWDDVRPNDAAGLLKQLLRDLPVPLLTLEYIDAFSKIRTIPELKEQIEALNYLIILLPSVHRETLHMVMRFLRKVVNVSQNKMTINNVAMIMAPNLFMLPSKSRPKTLTAEDLNMAAGTSSIVRMLINYQQFLGVIPGFMMQQLRHDYEQLNLKRGKEKPSYFMKFLKGKDKEQKKMPRASDETTQDVDPEERKKSDVQENLIRVNTAIKSTPVPCKLTEKTTAKDVINFVNRGSEPAKRNSYNGNNDNTPHLFGTTYLFEIGGNIGERRLDYETKMLALFRVNPQAEWIVRTEPG